MPRIEQIKTPDELPADQRAAGEAVVKTFGEIRGPFSILLRSAPAVPPALDLVHHFKTGASGSLRDRVLGILVAARERQAAYVWGVQVGVAREVGVREEAIDLIRAKGDPAKLPPEEGEIVAYAQQLVRNNRVDQATFDALLQRHGAQWLVELTAAIGFYGMLAGLVNAFEVPARPGADPLPS